MEYAAAAQQLIRRYEGLQLAALAAFARHYEIPDDLRTGTKPRSPKGVRAKRFGAEDVEELLEFAPQEIAAALTISPMSAGMRLGLAQDLDDRLSATRAAVAAGVLDGWKARLLVEKTRVLPGWRARIVEAQVLARAPKLTRGKLATELDPAGCRGRSTRRVRTARESPCQAAVLDPTRR